MSESRVQPLERATGEGPGDVPASAPARPPRRGGPASRRGPRQSLTPASRRLVIALGRAGLSIPALAGRFPHVVNRLSECWSAPARVVDVLDELLVDRRGGRRGFPADALAELLTLREAVARRPAARGAASPEC